MFEERPLSRRERRALRRRGVRVSRIADRQQELRRPLTFLERWQVRLEDLRHWWMARQIRRQIEEMRRRG